MGSLDVIELHENSANFGKVVEELVRIEKRAFSKYDPHANSLEEGINKDNSGLLYSQIGGEITGYIAYSWTPSSPDASITKLAVNEKYRRQGHGETLLRAAVERCRRRNIRRISLHVDTSRIPAMNLYKKLGFRVDSLVEKHYSDRDAYRMYLDFGPAD